VSDVPRTLDELIEHYIELGPGWQSEPEELLHAQIASICASKELAGLIGPLRIRFVPNRTVSIVTEGDALSAQLPQLPLLAGKKSRRGLPTAYVCENRVCLLPTSDRKVFEQQILEVTPLE